MLPYQSKPIILVPCASKKLGEASPAGIMYTSPYFNLCRLYAERFGRDWYIMSAKHGLLSPHKLVEPYEKTLSKMSVPECAKWARGVFDEFVSIYPVQYENTPNNYPNTPDLFFCRVYLLGGRLYRKHLAPLLMGYGYQVSVPFAGLGIGQQMAAMKTLLAISDDDHMVF